MRTLAESSESGKILIPQVFGRRASPVLFDRLFYEELAKLSDDRGGREVIAAHEDDAVVLPVACRDERAAFDIDTKDDYRAISKLND